MSGGLDGLREKLAVFLREQGLQAMTDWPVEPRELLDGPVAVVSLRGCRAGPAGFQHYLGERYDREREQWVEVYGQKVQLTFGLDLYARPSLGRRPCRPPWTSWQGPAPVQARWDWIYGSFPAVRPGTTGTAVC